MQLFLEEDKEEEEEESAVYEFPCTVVAKKKSVVYKFHCTIVAVDFTYFESFTVHRNTRRAGCASEKG